MLSYAMILLKVQTDAQQIEQTKFLFTIGDADNVNHIAVFMTGQTPFPDGLGGAGMSNGSQVLFVLIEIIIICAVYDLNRA